MAQQPPDRTWTAKTCKLPEDEVRIVRYLSSWCNVAIWFCVGTCGMSYRKDDGARTFLLDFPKPGVAGEACKPYAFDSLDEAEAFLNRLPDLREQWCKPKKMEAAV